MNSRERFLEVMKFGKPDHVPYFEEGIRKNVISEWKKQGLISKKDLLAMYPVDEREELEIDGYPHPPINVWPNDHVKLNQLENKYTASDARLPVGWRSKISQWNKRRHVLMLEVHHGFFLSMGVQNWNRFSYLINDLLDKPDVVKKIMQMTSQMMADLVKRFLESVKVDAVVFSEPIGGNNGPIISPKMYEEFVLQSYQPLLDVMQEEEIENLVFRTYANARALIPSIMKYGFNCLWACEVNTDAMDYRSIRKEFGRDLRLIGGIDLDALREGKEKIRQELEKILPPLLEEGGYIPLADGRVRSDIPLENYLFYRQLLGKITLG